MAPAMGLYSKPYRADKGGVRLEVYADVMKGRKLSPVEAGALAVGQAIKWRKSVASSSGWDEEGYTPDGDHRGKRYVTAADAEVWQSSKRGEVVGFGRRPRKRMIEKMAKIRNEDGCHFLALTCSDETWVRFDKADQAGMAAFLKQKKHAMEKRFKRVFPNVGGIWRLEFQERKSGALLGVPVPHLHLVIFGASSVKPALLQRWLSLAWYQVVGSGDQKHLRAGTNCRVLLSRRHAANYVSKYIGKEENDQFAAGRRWGAFGALDLSASVVVVLSVDQWIKLKRLVRGWLRSRRSRFLLRFAAMSAEVGASVLGLGDQSLAIRGAFSPTIFRMLQAVSDREINIPARQTVQA